jgi:hypothetical protein
MNRLIAALCCALFVVACDGRNGNILPAAPTTLPQSTSPASPRPMPPASVPATAIRIAVGHVVTARVTTNDPLCWPGWPYHCRHYALTAPSDGIFEVTMRWSSEISDPYPLDIGLLPPDEWLLPVVGPGSQRRLSFQVAAGAAYVIEISSYLIPGAEFDLTTRLLAN